MNSLMFRRSPRVYCSVAVQAATGPLCFSKPASLEKNFQDLYMLLDNRR